MVARVRLKQKKPNKNNSPLFGGVIKSTHTKEHRGDHRQEKRNNGLPQLLPGPWQEPAAPQRPISTNPEGHRTQWQAGTRGEDSQGHPGWTSPSAAAGASAPAWV